MAYSQPLASALSALAWPFPSRTSTSKLAHNRLMPVQVHVKTGRISDSFVYQAEFILQCFSTTNFRDCMVLLLQGFSVIVCFCEVPRCATVRTKPARCTTPFCPWRALTIPRFSPKRSCPTEESVSISCVANNDNAGPQAEAVFYWFRKATVL